MTVVPERMGLRATNGMERYIPSLSNDPTSLYRRYEPHLCAHDRFPHGTIRFLTRFFNSNFAISHEPINIDMNMSGYERNTITVYQSNYSSRKIIVLVVYQVLKRRILMDRHIPGSPVK